jgi:hypothetical protein
MFGNLLAKTLVCRHAELDDLRRGEFTVISGCATVAWG